MDIDATRKAFIDSCESLLMAIPSGESARDNIGDIEAIAADIEQQFRLIVDHIYPSRLPISIMHIPLTVKCSKPPCQFMISIGTSPKQTYTANPATVQSGFMIMSLHRPLPVNKLTADSAERWDTFCVRLRKVIPMFVDWCKKLPHAENYCSKVQALKFANEYRNANIHDGYSLLSWSKNANDTNKKFGTDFDERTLPKALKDNGFKTKKCKQGRVPNAIRNAHRMQLLDQI